MLASVPVVLSIVLLGYFAWEFPASLANGGAFRAAVSLCALSVYAGLSLWLRRQRTPQVTLAMRTGHQIGSILASAAVLFHSVEVFAALRPPMPAILGVSLWGLMFLLLGIAAAETARRGGSFLLSIASSLSSVLISAPVTVAYALSVGLLFMPRMVLNLGGGPAGVVHNMLEGAATHLLLAPVVAVAAGATSSLFYSAVKSLRSRTTVALVAVATLVCISGLSALRVASTLERSARPPYVMLGVLSLGVSLTALAALVAALRRQF